MNQVVNCFVFRVRSQDCLIANKFNLEVSPSAAVLQWLDIFEKTEKEKSSKFKRKFINIEFNPTMNEV